MDIQPSHRAQSIKPSPTMAVNARAAAMRALGRDILSLAAGEPDFDTPEHIKQAAIDALARGDTCVCRTGPQAAEPAAAEAGAAAGGGAGAGAGAAAARFILISVIETASPVAARASSGRVKRRPRPVGSSGRM